MDKANVSGPFPDPEIPDLDSAGYLVPPWVKYPNIRRGSIGWRMGAGEWYLRDIFFPYWRQLSDIDRDGYRVLYPAPAEWQGFLDPRIPDFDSHGNMVPPWVKFPKLARISGQWRIAHYRKFIDQFALWWATTSISDHEAFKIHNPEPSEWQGYLDALIKTTQPESRN